MYQSWPRGQSGPCASGHGPRGACPCPPAPRSATPVLGQTPVKSESSNAGQILVKYWPSSGQMACRSNSSQSPVKLWFNSWQSNAGQIPVKSLIGSNPGQILAISGKDCNLISHEVFFKSFCRSQLHQKSVNLSFSITNIKKRLTDLCRNWHLQNDFENTLREIKPGQRLEVSRSVHGQIRFGSVWIGGEARYKFCTCTS